ncbi:hypothetical protein ACWV26_08980 [Rummeliibacillus sp. JY-2-4R]
MNKKSIVNLTLTATLAFGTVSSIFSSTNTATAAESNNVANIQHSPSYKTASINHFKLVRTNKNVKIYTKTSTKSRVMDTVKNDQGLVVLKKYTNGWSKVSLQFANGYIQSKYLVNASPTKNPQYAMNTQKTYSYYSPENKGSGFNTNYKAKFQTVYPSNKSLTNFWYINSEPDAYGKMEYETTKGLYTGYKDIGIATLAIKYPVKLNNSWKGLDGQTFKIVATNKTVRTKAGSFKNVVVVKEGNGKNYTYYAPKIGLIKQMLNGKTITELTAIK